MWTFPVDDVPVRRVMAPSQPADGDSGQQDRPRHHAGRGYPRITSLERGGHRIEFGRRNDDGYLDGHVLLDRLLLQRARIALVEHPAARINRISEMPWTVATPKRGPRRV
jgi:hypothetical protein